jgi:glutaminyl-peptide cyclotransferase
MAIVLAAAAVAVAVGLGSDDEPARAPAAASGALHVDRFDADRAFADLRRQVEMGPRPAGSAASRRLARWLRARVPNGRYQKLPGGLRNVVGSIRGRGEPIVVAAHYDTKDLPGIVGANDGAGGTAAVLEIAHALRRADRPVTAPPIRFVFFDGEESPDDRLDFYRSGLRGSKPYARRYAARTRAVVLLDFVAERGRMRIPREAGSDPELWTRLRTAARKVGAGATFPADTVGRVTDDHTPFTRRGVPAIDLIDFTFPCWHETCDDMSAVSARSLDRTGESVVQLLLDLQR